MEQLKSNHLRNRARSPILLVIVPFQREVTSRGNKGTYEKHSARLNEKILSSYLS